MVVVVPVAAVVFVAAAVDFTVVAVAVSLLLQY